VRTAAAAAAAAAATPIIKITVMEAVAQMNAYLTSERFSSRQHVGYTYNNG
jgi:hypothetical protein